MTRRIVEGKGFIVTYDSEIVDVQLVPVATYSLVLVVEPHVQQPK